MTFHDALVVLAAMATMEMIYLILKREERE